MVGREADAAMIRQLERDWCDAWNAHDVQALADLLTPDADFVTVGGQWLRGRSEFVELHARLHSTRFKDSSLSVRGTTVKFVGTGMAIAHVTWRIKGDFNPDGTPRKPRTGIFSQFLTKSEGQWRILASQNTNDAPRSLMPTTSLRKRPSG